MIITLFVTGVSMMLKLCGLIQNKNRSDRILVQIKELEEPKSHLGNKSPIDLNRVTEQ